MHQRSVQGKSSNIEFGLFSIVRAAWTLKRQSPNPAHAAQPDPSCSPKVRLRQGLPLSTVHRPSLYSGYLVQTVAICCLFCHTAWAMSLHCFPAAHTVNNSEKEFYLVTSARDLTSLIQTTPATAGKVCGYTQPETQDHAAATCTHHYLCSQKAFGSPP